MSSAPRTAEPLLTVDEYLAFERAAEERHEYLDGRIIAMAGESLNQGIISANIVAAFVTQLKGTPCFALTKDSKIRSGPTPMSGKGRRGLFSYPDVIVVCGEPEFHDAHKDVILNPTVLVEILSPGTEAFDRGAKFDRYQTWTKTLTDYVLVSQDEPRIERYCRQDDGSWKYQRHAGIDTSVSLDSISLHPTAGGCLRSRAFPGSRRADRRGFQLNGFRNPPALHSPGWCRAHARHSCPRHSR